MAPKNTHTKYNKEIGARRQFGVEVECLRDKNSAISHVATYAFDSVVDGSLPRRTGEEKRSRPLNGEVGLQRIENLSNRLKEHKYTVNNKCGLHVHVDAEGFGGQEVWNVARFVWLFDDVIFSIMPEARRNNRYCKKFFINDDFKRRVAVGTYTMEKVFELFAERGDRYIGFNTAALAKHGTLEFRYHAGTIDSKKIINWVKVCVSIVEIWHKRQVHLKKRLTPTRTNVLRFCQMLALDAELTSYILGRWSKNNISRTNREIKINKILTAV